MLLGILVLITALSISAVAIYYSVAGLVAIFAAAAVPIIIMGSVLEVGKLVTAVWLHRYWRQATWWLKTYLTTAVVILMFITSMGIFGYLSKAHIEQTAQSTDNLAKVETVQNEIDRNLAIIGRAENKIRELDASQSNADTTIQEQIDKEQERIDTAYDRVQPLIDEQNKNLQDQIELFGLEKIDEKIAALTTAMNIDTKDKDAVRFLQSMVGARPDGAYGSGTAAKVEEYRNSLDVEREAILTKIQQARKTTNEEIARIRQGAEKQIAESNKLINRLREQLGAQDNDEEVQKAIDEQNERVRTVSSEIEKLTEQKIALQSEYRKLEAEVGPIKYIAEFIYGEADKTILEEAVRWVILTIIFVFDPLAVLLLIASQYTFEFARGRKDDNGERLRQEYEQLRAEKIANNTGYTVDPQTTEEKVDEEESNQGEPGQPKQEDAETLLEREDQESMEREERDDPPLVETSQEEKQRIADSYIEKKDVESSDESNPDLEQWNKWVEAAEAEVEKESKAILFGDDNLKKAEIKERANLVKQYANDPDWTQARELWQKENVDEDANTYRQAYISGRIHNLPWEEYLPEDHEVKKKRPYLMKQDGKTKRQIAEE